ncbi:MAG: winged helix-turn-helix domain-containing protein [Desulfitobacteriia bacterium]|jgi:DNA-binding transcriptional regulator YhcF (GntR family)
MLLEVLKEIVKNPNYSQHSLAKSLKIDPEMLKQIFQDLERMGYITTEKQECRDEICQDCVFCGSEKEKKKMRGANRISPTVWKLTEKAIKESKGR